MAGTRSRGSRTAGQHPDRNRDERDYSARIAAVDFALRAIVGPDEFPIHRESLFRARTGFRACRECGAAERVDAQPVAVVQPERTDLPLRAAKPGSDSAGP